MRFCQGTALRMDVKIETRPVQTDRKHDDTAGHHRFTQATTRRNQVRILLSSSALLFTLLSCSSAARKSVYRLDVPRFTSLDPRFTIHDSRFTLPVHSAQHHGFLPLQRCAIHGSFSYHTRLAMLFATSTLLTHPTAITPNPPARAPVTSRTTTSNSLAIPRSRHRTRYNKIPLAIAREVSDTTAS